MTSLATIFIISCVWECSLSPEVKVEKHCILVCNTPPSAHHSIGSLTFAGKDYKHMIKIMTGVCMYVQWTPSNLDQATSVVRTLQMSQSMRSSA